MSREQPPPDRLPADGAGEQLCLFEAAEPVDATAADGVGVNADRTDERTRMPVAPPGAAPAQALLARLSPHFGGRLRSLVLTRNRRRILSVRAEGTGSSALALRLDACFVDADAATLAAVARWATGQPGHRQALAVLRAFCDRRRVPEGDSTRPASPASRRPPPTGELVARGRCFDLGALLAGLNRDYFDDEITAAVTWGQASRRSSGHRRPRRQTIRLGSYDYEHGLIRIHPVLDQPKVPRYVVESVLHHEMVHAALPAVVRNGRRRYHTPTFRALERRYRQQAQADAWIAAHLDWLLKARYGKS